MLRLRLPGWRIDRGAVRAASRIVGGGGRNGAVSNIERYDRNDKAATMAALFFLANAQNFYRFPSGADLLHSSTMSTEQQDQSAEERIGSMIGKIFVLALVAFFLWGYSTTLLAKLGFF